MLKLTPVGVRGWSMGRGEVGVEGGDVGAAMILAAESGLLESLRRQASLQYKIELHGVDICFSHMALQESMSQWLGSVSFPR